MNATSQAFHPGKKTVPIVQEAGWAPTPVWASAENLAVIGIRSPDRSASSESLHRLRYCGPQPGYVMWPMQIHATLIHKRRKPVILLLPYVCSKTTQNITFCSQASVGSMEVADRSVKLVTRLKILYNVAWYRDLIKISYV